MLPPPIGRVGLAAGHNEKLHLAARACNLASGGLYTYPTSTDVIDATKPITFKWDNTCALSATSIDLHLYAASSTNGLIHTWADVDFSAGQYAATLSPKWWNDTTTAQLQLSIIKTGADAWDTSSPPGPVFTINYAASAMSSVVVNNGQTSTVVASAASTQVTDAVVETVASENGRKGISKGAIAAAVIVPLLVLAVVAAVSVRFWRAREAEKRKRWSQALSTHSGLEWEKGAQPGEKPHSILGRPSTQMGRPSTHHSARPGSMATSSVYAVENNMAGTGAGRAQQFPRPSFGDMRAQSSDNLPQRVSMVGGNPRQSRISFADTARPDRRSRLSLGGDLRPTVTSSPGLFKLPSGTKSATELATPKNSKFAAYATGSAIDDDDAEEGINVSPSQMQGPNGFAEADMRRAGKGTRTGRRSIMSLGGGDKRRHSTASALSADDFKSAASARGSVDELRDMEAIMLMRRSMISQYSANKSSPSPDSYNPDEVEHIDDNDDTHLSAASPMPAMPSPIAGSSTVAYGPDQMLAVYAARGKVATASAPSTSIPSTKPQPSRQNSAMRVLGNLTGKKEDASPAVTPAPTGMKSMVHLHNGTASSKAVDALPAPGPVNGLTVPKSSQPSSRFSAGSDGSRYSQGEVSPEEEYGEAK